MENREPAEEVKERAIYTSSERLKDSGTPHQRSLLQAIVNDHPWGVSFGAHQTALTRRLPLMRMINGVV
jgi:hypothetical protein